MDKKTLLTSPIHIKEFTARGEITVDENLLSYDIQNGIASFRFIKRKSGYRDISIVKDLTEKWIFFEDYDAQKNNDSDDLRISHSFFALLTYGYYFNNVLCFYVDTIIKEIFKADIYTLDIFSPCLINHFEDARSFDYKNNGYVEDCPCAEYVIDKNTIKIYRTIGVEFSHNKINLRLAFQKTFVGGFRFVSDVPFTNSMLKKCVDAVNGYCCFILRDAGNFVTNVGLIERQEEDKSYLYYPPEAKQIKTEILFSFDDIKTKFASLMSLFFEKDKQYDALYTTETNVYKPIDILRVASMFENQYRRNVELGMPDYVEQEKLYRETYFKVIKIDDTVEGVLVNRIVDGEKCKRKRSVMSSLKMQLQFVFDKLLNVLGTNKELIKNSLFARLFDYDISKLATIIKEARNDIAHYLESNVNYIAALKNTYVLQLMIYYMIFESIGLSNKNIKKIILGTSFFSDGLFGIKNNN